MSEGTVLIEGKEFVSSDRAAKLVGYTKDYVGQLARAGKIEAKRVGRSWYIGQDSITKHKLSVHYTLTKPKKPKKNNDEEEKSLVYEVKKELQHITPKETQVIKTPEISHFRDIPNFESEEYDLLPRLKEKKRDVLLHSDIRFETPRQRVVQSDSVAQNLQNHNAYVKSVPIRKPLRRPVRAAFDRQELGRRAELHHERSMPVRIDGIQVDGIRVTERRREIRKIATTERRPVNVQPHARVVEPMYDQENVYPEEENAETSKIIPVVGAILVFTLFVVIYIFATA